MNFIQYREPSVGLRTIVSNRTIPIQPRFMLATMLFCFLTLSGCFGRGAPADSTTTPDLTPTPSEAASMTADSTATAEAVGGEPTRALDSSERLVVYSIADEQEEIQPLIDAFSQATGIGVQMIYGGQADLAARLLKNEVDTSGDVFIDSDVNAIGALAKGRVCMPLPQELLEQVDQPFRGAEDRWLGLAFRLRVMMYNTDLVTPDELPESILELASAEWQGRVGWKPNSATFRAFLSAMSTELGEEGTRQWLEGLLANEAVPYKSNGRLARAVGSGGVAVGLVNHYHLTRPLDDDVNAPVRNYYFPADDIGATFIPTTGCILHKTQQLDKATALLSFLLSAEAQRLWVEVNEYYPVKPLDMRPFPWAPSRTELKLYPIDWSKAADLSNVLHLLLDVGVSD